MSKTINKLLALLLALTLLAGLAGCASSENPEQTEAPTVTVKPVKMDPCTELGTPLADVRVRQALAYAIDLDTIMEALFYDNAWRAVSFTAPLGEELAEYEYDPEKAKALLEKEGRVRGKNPLNSFAALGKNAERLISPASLAR